MSRSGPPEASLLPSGWEVEQRRRREFAMERQWLDALSGSSEPLVLAEHDRIVFANATFAGWIDVPAARLQRLRLSEFLIRLDRTGKGDLDDGDEAGYLLSLDGRMRPVVVDTKFVRYKRRIVRQYRFREPSQLSQSRAHASERVFFEGRWEIELATPLEIGGIDAPRLRATLLASPILSVNPLMERVLQTAHGLSEAAPDVNQLLSFLGDGFVEALVSASFQVNGIERHLECADGLTRHFLISSGLVQWSSYVFRVTGSCLEVTDHVEMEQRMVSALEEQRERLGRDLHDGVGQLLTGVKILSSNLAREQKIHATEVRIQAAKIARMAEEAQLNVRQVYRGLSANHLRHLELSDALSDLTEFVVTMPEVEGNFYYDGCATVQDLELKLQLYRIAQEAINNSLKHSSASHMTISWFEDGGKLVLQVCDDGIGFDAGSVSGKTLGLHSMQYRARLIGGKLTLTTHPGAGTTVRCELDKPPYAA